MGYVPTSACTWAGPRWSRPTRERIAPADEAEHACRGSLLRRANAGPEAGPLRKSLASPRLWGYYAPIGGEFLPIHTGRRARPTLAGAPRRRTPEGGQPDAPDRHRQHRLHAAVLRSLVMLMTPGLAFFYGGLVGRKNVLAIMIQSFVSMGWTTVLWWAVRLLALLLRATSGGVIGNLDMAVPARRRPRHAVPGNASIPLIVFVAYQMMFAIITPALITGAFANRVRFKAYLLFLTRLAAPRLLPVRPHGLGRRPAGEVGRARLRRRHRRAQHRRHRGARLGPLRRPAQGRRTAARTASRWSRSAPACSGSAGTASTPAASSGSTRSPPSPSSTPTSPPRSPAIAWLAHGLDDVERSRSSSASSPARSPASPRSRPAAGYVSPHTRGAHRHHRRASSASSRSRSRTGCSWDDALDVWGVHGVGGFLGIILLRHLRHARPSTRPARTACSRATPRFFLKQLRRGR